VALAVSRVPRVLLAAPVSLAQPVQAWLARPVQASQVRPVQAEVPRALPLARGQPPEVASCCQPAMPTTTLDAPAASSRRVPDTTPGSGQACSRSSRVAPRGGGEPLVVSRACS
jgi:hypothetical protein